jgi:hypothetical protein
MSGPPEDLSPGELFLKLQERPRPSDVVPFPRRTESGKAIDNIRIAVLSGEDHDLARIEARKFVKTKYKLTDEDLKDPLVAAVQGDAVARELLAMACLQEKPAPGSEGHEREFYPRAFPDGPSVGKALGADEVAVLFSNYLLVQHKYGPFEKTIQSEQELSAWIKRLVEGAAEHPLRHLSLVQWAEAASLLAVRAYTLSVILESLFESLPTTLKSRLGSFSLGTGFFGRPAADSPPIGSESSGALKLSDVPITREEAEALALALREKPDVESNIMGALDALERDPEES